MFTVVSLPRKQCRIVSARKLDAITKSAECTTSTIHMHHKNGEVLVVDEAHTLNLYQSKASLNLQNC